jgi:hypothetical protein
MKSLYFSVVALSVAQTAPAIAQTSYFYPTEGFILGEKSRIHTDLVTGVVFDSNSQRAPRTVSEPTSDVRINVKPGITVEVPGTKASFGLTGHFLYSQFLNVNETTTGQDNALLGGDVGLQAKVGTARSPAALSISNLLIRTPTVLDAPGTNATDERAFRAWTNQASVTGTFRPGGGALEFDLGYTQNLLIYDDLAPNQQHGGVFEVRYRFLPRTALIFHTGYSLFEPDDPRLRNSDGDIVERATNRSAPLNLWLGASGQITARLNATIAAGYANSFTYQDSFYSALAASSQETVIGQVRLGYQFTDTIDLNAGYNRSIRPVVELDNLISDLIDVRYSMQLFSRLIFQLYGGFEWRNFGVGEPAANVDHRSAHLLTGDVSLTYYFFDFLTGSVKYRITNQESDDEDLPASSTLLLGEFTRHQVFFNVGLNY